MASFSNFSFHHKSKFTFLIYFFEVQPLYKVILMRKGTTPTLGEEQVLLLALNIITL
jgi:hypothetical protein